MADVTWQRPDYTNALTDWQLCSDAADGERKIKAGKTTYLPKPNPDDPSPKNDKRYKNYLARAVFYPATGRTRKGLVSLVYRKEPSHKLPSALEYVNEDIDGSGNSITKQSQKALGRILTTGRHGLFVDYPRTDGPVSRAVKDAQGIRATTISIKAEQVINWRTTKIGGKHMLSLVVFKETAIEIDGFENKEVEQYRELALIDGVYTVQVWRKAKDEKTGREEWAVYEGPYTPLDGAGRTWSEIPFIFPGSENNDPDIDEAPLLDLARLNIAHYRNSADYEDSAFFVGQAQPVITGLDEAWADRLEKNGVYIGSRNALPLPVGADYKLAQALPNTLVKEAMDAKERQMVAIGAHLIEKGSAVKTATQQDSEDAVAHSVVSLCASNLSEAYEQCLRWMAAFENVPDTGIEFQLSQDYTSKSIEPQMLQAMVAAWQSGAFAKFDLRRYLRRLDVIDPERTDEEIDTEMEEEDPGPPLQDDITDPASPLNDPAFGGAAGAVTDGGG